MVDEARARLARAQAARRALVLLEVDEDGGARQPVKIRAERVRALRRAPVAALAGAAAAAADAARLVAAAASAASSAATSASSSPSAPGTTKVPSGTPARASTRSSTCRLSAAHCACASSGYGPSELVKLEAVHGGGEPLGLLGWPPRR